MPNIEALAKQGIVFRNAYAPPSCSPSRAALLTGRQPRRFELGTPIRPIAESVEVPLSEITLPEALQTAPIPYASSAVGKWHLSAYNSPSGLRHPLASGFDWYAGSVANLRSSRKRNLKSNYNRWEKNINGVLSTVKRYATSDTIDDALKRVQSMPSPWVLWVAFNAPHIPLHKPPAELTKTSIRMGKPRIAAVIEAVDTEIGRLLKGIPADELARTFIVFLGDNGTSVQSSEQGAGHAKGSVYEAGVRVPLVVSGHGVTMPGEVHGMVHIMDLFPTFLDLAGVDVAKLVDEDGKRRTLDGFSLLPYLQDPDAAPVRDTIFQDAFIPNGPGPYTVNNRMIRDTRYKLIYPTKGDPLFYDMKGRIIEGEPLIDPQGPALEARTRLAAQLEARMRELIADD
jgi:arylsulfatase A-like enzyme